MIVLPFDDETCMDVFGQMPEKETNLSIMTLKNIVLTKTE